MKVQRAAFASPARAGVGAGPGVGLDDVNATYVGAYKFVFIGDSSVGKTSILTRLCNDEFTPAFAPTLGIDFRTLDVKLSSGDDQRVQIWDTAGQERYKAITSAYYRGANAVFLVFAIDAKPTFESAAAWLEEYRRANASASTSAVAEAHVILALIGNKCDKENARTVSSAAAIEWARSQGLSYYETSAKTGAGIGDCIAAVTEQVFAATTAAAAAAAAAEEDRGGETEPLTGGGSGCGC